MVEDSYQQVLRNISKSHNIQQEYATMLWELDLLTENPDKYHLHVLQGSLNEKQKLLDRVIIGNLLQNHVTEDKIRDYYTFNNSLTADTKRPK